MSELEDRINSVLSDPGQMERITKLAQSLMGAQGTQSGQGSPGGPGDALRDPGGDGALPDMELIGRIGRLMRADSAQGKNGQALLEAMKPYLSEKRRGKMDRAMKIAKLARIARLAMGESEAGGDA